MWPLPLLVLALSSRPLALAADSSVEVNAGELFTSVEGVHATTPLRTALSQSAVRCGSLCQRTQQPASSGDANCVHWRYDVGTGTCSLYPAPTTGNPAVGSRLSLYKQAIPSGYSGSLKLGVAYRVLTEQDRNRVIFPQTDGSKYLAACRREHPQGRPAEPSSQEHVDFLRSAAEQWWYPNQRANLFFLGLTDRQKLGTFKSLRTGQVVPVPRDVLYAGGNLDYPNSCLQIVLPGKQGFTKNACAAAGKFICEIPIP